MCVLVFSVTLAHIHTLYMESGAAEGRLVHGRPYNSRNARTHTQDFGKTYAFRKRTRAVWKIIIEPLSQWAADYKWQQKHHTCVLTHTDTQTLTLLFPHHLL